MSSQTQTIPKIQTQSNNPSEENLRFDFRLSLSGGGELPLVFQGSTELPLGLQKEFIHQTQISFETLLEVLIQKPVIMACVLFLHKRYNRLNPKVAEKRAAQQKENIAPTPNDSARSPLESQSPNSAKDYSVPPPEAPKMAWLPGMNAGLPEMPISPNTPRGPQTFSNSGDPSKHGRPDSRRMPTAEKYNLAVGDALKKAA
jgi:hypothetical protein